MLRRAMKEDGGGIAAHNYTVKLDAKHELREARCSARAGVQLVTDMPLNIVDAVKETGKGETVQLYLLKFIEDISSKIAGKFVPAVVGNYHLDKVVEAIFDLKHVLSANYDADAVHDLGGGWDSPAARKCGSWQRLLDDVDQAMQKAQAKAAAAYGREVVDGEFAAFW